MPSARSAGRGGLRITQLADALSKQARAARRRPTLCELPDGTVSYEEFGEGRAIVMMHGFGVDHTSMVRDMEPIFTKREGWRRIYLDMPGHGGTGATRLDAAGRMTC